MKDNLPLSLVAAFLIGVAQMLALTAFWAFFPIYSPITALDLSAWIHGAWLRAAVFGIDAIMNVLLCLPAAWAILKLRPNRLAMYLLVAIVPGFMWQYQNLWMAPSQVDDWLVFVPGAILAALVLPASVLVLQMIAKSKVSDSLFNKRYE
jgi:hypothetical protein